MLAQLEPLPLRHQMEQKVARLATMGVQDHLQEVGLGLGVALGSLQEEGVLEQAVYIELPAVRWFGCPLTNTSEHCSPSSSGSPAEQQGGSKHALCPFMHGRCLVCKRWLAGWSDENCVLERLCGDKASRLTRSLGL